ncbi:hypothetical protein BGX23_007149 [Mortierella sp. AD031]|nr:hypothetical protein BGX23_007149 [Mortierella sp. AD031]KAG0206177.1 hypothetical protein BGX33_007558 [Mortierella sp. NVP41]
MASTDLAQSAFLAPSAAPALATPPAAGPLNFMDLCIVLPTEIWHQFLEDLLPSGITRISTVSRTWLNGTRSHPVWTEICEMGGLHRCVHMFSSQMAFVPLPVAMLLRNNINDDVVTVLLNVCHLCRFESYYLTDPEHNPDYLQGLPYFGLLFDGADLDLDEGRDDDIYLHSHVQERALEIHGGWAGIEAIRFGVAERRQVEFERRCEEALQQQQAAAVEEPEAEAEVAPAALEA